MPLRNEELNLPPLLQELDSFRASFPHPLEVVLVDDGSVDRSWATIKEHIATRPWLRAVRLRAHRGQTAAMMAGVRSSTGEYVTFLDADLQNDPADIPRLLAPVIADEADVVCGWRRDRKDHALLRTLPSHLANWMIRKVLHVPIHDLGCTLKVFRREYLTSINMVGEMHRFLAAYAQAEGARLMEMEVHHRPRLHGESKYGLSRVGKVLIDLLTVLMLNVYGSSPGYLFGKVAALCFVLGTAMFSVVAYRVLALHRYEATPMVFVSVLMYIASLIALMSGLLAELNVRVLQQVGVYKPYDVRERIGFKEDERCAASSAD